MSRRRPWVFPDTRSPICTIPNGSRPSTTGSAKKWRRPIPASGASGTPTGAAPDAPRPPIALSNLLIGDGAARQPLRGAAVRRRARAADALAPIDARPGRPLPLQGRLRPPPRAAAAEGRRARRRRRRKTTRSSTALIAGASTATIGELAIARAGCALLDREKAAPAPARRSRPRSPNRGAEALVRRAHPRSGVSRAG